MKRTTMLIGVWTWALSAIIYVYACAGAPLPKTDAERAIYCHNLETNTRKILEVETDPNVREGVRLQMLEYAEEAGCK